MNRIEFTVNGEKCSVGNELPRDLSLNAYLRYVKKLPGTKAMCHEGGCGACIVSVTAPRQPGNEIETFSVNSCLVLVFSCQGWEITTVEGIGNRLKGYHSIQKRIREFNGTQCGYCTPGWVMQMFSLLDKHLTMTEIEKSFASNTCRCTGFRPILDTVKSFAVDASPQLYQKVRDIEDLSQIKICQKNGKTCAETCSVKSEDDWCIVKGEHDELKAYPPIEVNFGKYRFYKVCKVNDIFAILNNEGYDSYMLVAGNTAKGIYENFEYPRILIDINDVKELQQYYFDQNLVIGANYSLEDARKLFIDTSESHNEFFYLSEFAKHIEEVAHIPVRKLGTIAGNLMLKHSMPFYQSDIFLLFETVGAVLTVQDEYGTKTTLTLPQFLNFNMQGVVMINIKLPPLSKNYILKTYKVMPRNQNALAIVNAGFLLKKNKTTQVIENVRIVYGNISSSFIHAEKTEEFLEGKIMPNNKILQRALQILSSELIVKENPPEPSSDCRKKLALGLFYKFSLSITSPGVVSPEYRSGAQLIKRPVSCGTQDFQTDQQIYPLNQAVPKLEGLIQASGEAEYINDIPEFPKEVFGAFVLSTVHSGEIEQIDTTEVLEIEGVYTIYTAKDIPGTNTFTRPGIQLQTEYEEILASKYIKYHGQPVAIVVAKTEQLAKEIAKKVKINYKSVSATKPILKIDEARKDSNRLKMSDESIEPKGRGNNVKKVIRGRYEVHAQYHYYMEPMTCVVAPVDEGLEVYSSTQWIDLAQIGIADSLKMKESDIHFKLRRIGGGFGGKISRSGQVSAACALVAKKMNAPCRFVLPMQTNLTIAGRRLPTLTEYETGVDDDGKIQYLNMFVIQDDGCSHNENIISFVVGGLKNCYDFDYWSAKLGNVRTDLASNTFARAPGTCEGISTIEHIMEHIAFAVKKNAQDVRLVNMRKEDNDLPQLIEQHKKETDYEKRVQEIKQFNEVNRWMNKAIKISVMAFPVQFYGNYRGMVSIYRGDGSVTVSTGGVEMGQGVNTKAAQVCAYTLDIPLEYVSVIPNYSFVAANDVFSGSSITSESVCYSIIKACEIIKSRLAPIKDSMPNANWKELIAKAGEEEIDLTATYMMNEKEPDLSNYSAFAVAILEVQLDVLIGRYEILRVDILEDVGLSANPTVDVGQVEGAYIQGLGYYTSEVLKFDQQTGKLLTNRSLNYHVPLALDIPIDFRVKLRYNSKNPKGVLGSKAVGEMGICLAQGINHALRECIHESRKQSGCDPNMWIDIDIPYDTESILKALDTKIEEFIFAK